MKLDREFSFEELPKRVRTSIEEIVKKHVEHLVQDYDDTLQQEGKFIGRDEQEYLVERISDAAKITVKISAKCDGDVLEACKVYPKDRYQNKLDDFGGSKRTEITLTHDGKSVTTTPEQMQQAIDIMEKRRAAAEEAAE